MLLSHKTEESSQIDSDIQYTQLEMDELKRREDDLERADAALEVAADAYRSTLSAIVSEKVIKKLEDLELANSVKRSKLNAFRSTLISSRMTELRKKLDVLERVSPAKAANVVAYEHILSSVRLLPPSILGIIFQYATQRCPNTLR
ncbi:hypothetical protein C0991_009841 [Blastosporella zonata]|nr:hypothetical protein C0991_009841 [Blastosporella zonata]